MGNTGFKILHIAAHLGEGAGKAISGLAVADANNRHKIILLEKPNKTGYVDHCRANDVPVAVCSDEALLKQHLSNCDAVVINWWNHPTMIAVLRMLCDIPARVLLWSHVNGLNYPLLQSSLADIFDFCLFTSPISLKSPYWSKKERKIIQNKSEVVYGMGDFRPNEHPYKNDYKLHTPIRIGYVGTLNYAKLHPSFITYCRAVADKGVNACFVLAGEPNPSLLEDVKRENLTNHFEFLGFQKNIMEILTTFDIFGYLLNPNNFATTENALLEAMAAGLPIITSCGEAERAIITDEVDGFTVANPNEYADKIIKLTPSKDLRSQLGTAARDSACKKYNVVENVQRFNKAVCKAMEIGKSKHDFTSVLGETPFDAFLSSCHPNVKAVFSEAASCDNNWYFSRLKEKAKTLGEIFKTDRKGSAFQFASCFPEDKKLHKICALFE